MTAILIGLGLLALGIAGAWFLARYDTRPDAPDEPWWL